MLMGYREYARHRGCALSAVQKAIKTGRVKTTEKKIDSEAADISWAASTDPAKQRKEPPTPPPPPPAPLLDGEPLAAPAELSRRVEWPEITEPWPPPVVKRSEERPLNMVEMDTFLAAKTERERAEAERAKIALARERGRLIDAEDARQTWRAIGKMFAAARENVPIQLAIALAGKSDVAEIERLIRAAFQEADRRIADEIQSRFAEVVDGARYRSVAG